MFEIQQFLKTFYKSYISLSEELIFRLEKDDLAGQINNVIIGINKECFGTRLFEEPNNLIFIELYYITNVTKLEGCLIQLELYNAEFSRLLFKFCATLSQKFINLNEIQVYNTYQNQLRSLLEKDNYFTITENDLDFINQSGKNPILLNTHYKDIIKIHLISMVDFYREFFENNYSMHNDNHFQYVYLMVNTETAYIKIGFSKNPQYRERTLQSQEPQIYRIACWKAKREIETELHRKFKHKRVRGEYFNLKLNDLKEIKEYMEKYNFR